MVPVQIPNRLQPVPTQNFGAMPGVQPPYGGGIGIYGSVQDPMFHAIYSVPPPFRPQFQGETFMARVSKNIALRVGEAICEQALLAFRQATLFPAVVIPKK